MNFDFFEKSASSFLATKDESENLIAKVVSLEIAKIEPDPNQPRKHFDEVEIQNLADDIKEHGLIQPITVRRSENQSGYIIVTGERRYRATKLLGLERIDCIVRENLDPNVLLFLQVSENKQRDNLKFWEYAEVCLRLLSMTDENGQKLSQQTIAKLLGTNKSEITRFCKWAEAPQYLKDLSIEGKINSLRLFYTLYTSDLTETEVREILKDGELSVRELKSRMESLRASKNPSNSQESSNSSSYEKDHTSSIANNGETALDSVNDNEDISNNTESSSEQNKDKGPVNNDLDTDSSDKEISSTSAEFSDDESDDNADSHSQSQDAHVQNTSTQDSHFLESKAYQISCAGRRGRITSGIITVTWDDGTVEDIEV